MTDPPIATPWSRYPPSQATTHHHHDGGPLPPRTSPPPAPPPISPEDALPSRPRGSSASSPRRPGLPNRNTSSSYKSDIQDNFRHSISISIPAPVGSMSISPANRDVVLASRKGLYIIDLTNPSRLPRFLPQGGLRSVADCQWNPSSTRPRSVVSTSAQKLLLWDLGLPSHRAISREVDAHTRAISDINWAVFNPDVVATAGIDGWIKCWDVRTSMDKDAGRFSAWGWGSGATQVKWNRKEEHIVASSHDNKVLIWDRRMGSIPVTRIRAHSAKIYGIDWSREAGDEIVTCSLDKTIKLWNISSPSLPVSTTLLSSNTNLEPIPTISPLESALTKTLSVPLRTIHTASPVWRARFLPFGSGLLSLPQSQETGLDMWTVDRSFHQPSATNPEGGMGVEGIGGMGGIGEGGGEGDGIGDGAKVIKKFEGHTDKVKEFVWRTRGGDDMERDDRTFQLITWGKDQSLRFWPIEEKTMLDAGHKPNQPIRVIMTRRGAIDQSFIEEPPLAPLTSSPTPFDSSSNLSLNQQQHHQPQQLTHHQYQRRRHMEAVVSAPLPQVLAGVRPRQPPLRHPFESGSSSDGSSKMGGGASGLSRMMGGGEGGGASKRLVGSRSRSRRETPVGDAGAGVEDGGTRKKIQKRVVMTRGTTGMGMAIKTDLSTAAQNWNENVNYHPVIHDPQSRSNSPAGGISTSRSSAGRRRVKNRSTSRMTSTSNGRSLSRPKNADDSTYTRMSDEGRTISLMEKAYGFKMKSFPVTTSILDVEIPGPWGPLDPFTRSRSTNIVHLVINFPPTYPKVQGILTELDIGGEPQPRLRKELRADLEALIAEPGNCMEKVLKYVLGVEKEEETRGRDRMTSGGGKGEEMESSESESDEEGEGVVETVLTKHLLQIPCGASFGPNGELVCHFNTASSHRSGSRRASQTSALPSGSAARWSSVGSSNADRPLSHLDEAMSRLTSTIKTEDGKRAAPKMVQDLALMVHPRSRARARSRPRELASQATALATPRSTSAPVRLAAALQIFNVSDLTLSSRTLAERYVLGGRDAVRSCGKNAVAAREAGRLDHEAAWTSLGELLVVPKAKSTSVPPRDRSRAVVWGVHPSGRKQVDALLSHFASMGDFQMVATMLNLLVSALPPPSKPAPLPTAIAPTPGSDYFTHMILPPTTSNPSSRPINSPGPPTPRRPPTSTRNSSLQFRSSSPSSPNPSSRFTSNNASSWSFGILSSIGSAASGSDSGLVDRIKRTGSPGPIVGSSSSKMENEGALGASGLSNERLKGPRDDSPLGRGDRQQTVVAAPKPVPRGKGIRVEFLGETRGKSLNSAPSSLISPQWFVLAELSQHIYADLLFRWDLLQQRAKLLQPVFHPRTPTQLDLGLDLVELAPPSHLLRRALGPPSLSGSIPATTHHDQGLCSVCGLTVEVSSSTCLRCLHTSHAHCFDTFFSPPSSTSTDSPATKSCPTGCGCPCSTVPDDLLRFPLRRENKKMNPRTDGSSSYRGFEGGKWRDEQITKRSFREFV